MDNEQLMKFQITKNKLKMEIKLSDLVWLFHNNPNNIGPSAKILRGKRKEFAEWIVDVLQSDARWDEDNVLWGKMFDDAFSEALEGFADCDEFIEFSDD